MDQSFETKKVKRSQLYLQLWAYSPFALLVIICVWISITYNSCYLYLLISHTYTEIYVPGTILTDEVISSENMKATIYSIILFCFSLLWFVALVRVMITKPGSIPKKWNIEAIHTMKEMIAIKNFVLNHRTTTANQLDVDVMGRMSLSTNDKLRMNEPLKLPRSTAPSTMLDEEDSFDVAISKIKKNDLKELFDKEDKRYCYNCHNFKPDRSHHCNQCNKCVLKMDHHCLWIMNCVGFYNYKYFILFLFYSNLLLLFILVTSWEFFIDTIQNDQFSLLYVLYIMTFYFVILGLLGILSFFFSFHIRIILNNKTTIEHCENKPSKWDLGSYYSNWCSVFGKIPYWFLPTHPNLEGEGISFQYVEKGGTKTCYQLILEGVRWGLFREFQWGLTFRTKQKQLEKLQCLQQLQWIQIQVPQHKYECLNFGLLKLVQNFDSTTLLFQLQNHCSQC